jgi:hypothetical protein
MLGLLEIVDVAGGMERSVWRRGVVMIGSQSWSE